MKINKFCLGDHVKHIGKLKTGLYGEVIALFDPRALSVIGMSSYFDGKEHVYLVKSKMPSKTTIKGKKVLMEHTYLKESDLTLCDWIDEMNKEINK